MPWGMVGSGEGMVEWCGEGGRVWRWRCSTCLTLSSL